MDTFVVRGISATVEYPSTFLLGRYDAEPISVTSRSALIQRVLLEAFFTGAEVPIEFVQDSTLIKRVEPFYAGQNAPPPYPRKYRVSRLATQKGSDGSDEHLEAFLLKNGDEFDKAYNVYDQLLQQVLEAAFGRVYPPEDFVLDVEFDGEEIKSVALGALEVI